MSPLLRAGEDNPGVVVVSVIPGLAADQAGLCPGDRLLHWSQPPAAEGTLRSPFDVMALEIERGPRGPVEIAVVGGEAPRHVSLSPDEWGLVVRPALPPEALAEYELALRSTRDGQPAASVAAFRRLVDRLAEGPPEGAAWALLELAEEQLRTNPDEARLTAGEAVSKAARPRVQAMVHAHFAEALRKRSRLAEAATAYAEAIRLEESLDPEGLGLARMIEGSGFVAYGLLKGLPEATTRLERGLRILERDAPRSLARARTLQALAQTLSSTVKAKTILGPAAELAEALAPESLTHASILYAQAWVTPTADQLPLAEHALAIRERLAPESLATAASIRLVALSLGTFGRLDEAKAYFLRDVALLERIEPVGSTMAGVLESLGSLAGDRGELADAERYLRRAVEVRTRVGLGSRTAITLLNLADLLVLRRELDEAERHLKHARAILEEELPDSEYLAYALRSLGDLAFARGDAAGAESCFRRSLESFKKVNPTGFAVATVQSRLCRALGLADRLEEAQAACEDALRLSGDVDEIKTTEIQDDLAALALRRNDPATARKWLEEALSARKRLAPGSIWEAISEHSLGRLAREQGRRAEALSLFREAVKALEAQSLRLGGSAETSAAFRAHFQEFYRDLEDVLIEGGEEKEALGVVERARARSLLALLAQRDLQFPEVPADLERERRQADTEHDSLIEQLAPLGAEDPQRKDLLRRFGEARHHQEEVRTRIRAAAPRLSTLRDPQPLDLEGVRRALDPGTLLLVYSLGPAKSRVYAVGPGPEDFAVRDLGAASPQIRESVQEFRKLIEERRGLMLRQGLDAQSRALSRLLLGPIGASLVGAKRVLVVPDGVLHQLPFSALRDPADATGRRYLIESRPIHVVSSVTLYAQLAGPRASPAGRGVVGFGDPARAGGAATGVEDTTVTRASKLGLRFGALPAARRELEALRTLSPESSRIWLGAEATEERAKAVGREARILHFATHGFVDEDFPLESGLALSTPAHWTEGQDNGLLQAWEVFESVRLDADLVTLSACQTALGKAVGGEGLLGLTWAFQYAGARSVLASLWEVNDASTAELMRRFYGYLGGGVSTAEALRAAQLDVLRRPETRAPFFWAAFELIGDWH